MIFHDRNSVFEDFAKSLHIGQKTTEVVPASQIQQEHFANPEEIGKLKVSVNKLKNSTSSDEAGILRLKKVIKDRTKFIRLYLTADTVAAFNTLNALASFRLLAWIVDSLTDTEDNSIVFDQSLLEYYNLTYKSYRTAVKDLQKSRFLLSAELDGPDYEYISKSHKYYVNPAIFQCGIVKEDALEKEKKVRRKFDKIITDPQIIAQLGIRHSSFEAVSAHMLMPEDSLEKKNGTKYFNGIYVSSDQESLPPFFKVFRGSFSNALLSLEHKCSARIMAFIIDTYLPQDKDYTYISRQNVCNNVHYAMSKSTFYRVVGDLTRSGLIYRDIKNKKYYINPFCWYNGSAYRLLSSCKSTDKISEKIMTKKEKKRMRFAKFQNAKLCNELSQSLYNNA